MERSTRRPTARARGLVLPALLSLALAAPARAQWITTYEQAYLSASHNWTWRDRFPEADRLFNAFDYGHAILSERLITRPGNVETLEVEAFDYLTGTLLVTPPRLPLAEGAIAPRMSRLAPEIMAMFNWAHLLHRQVYDVLADPRIPDAARDTAVATLVRWYRSRPDLAFSSRPKTMALMQEQPYSLAFRQRYPKFNGLIWAYHWLQMGLYEPLVTAKDEADRRAGVAEALKRFRRMLADPPNGLPVVMPMTPAVAPAFAARYPEASIIFDNLHSLHDVVSDVLANTSVSPEAKRATLLAAAAAYRDDTTEVMSVDGWRRMALMMGIENMGGPVLEGSGGAPTPTVARGAVMRHDKDGNMIGDHAMHHATPGMDAAAAPRTDSGAARDTTRAAPPAMDHAAHAMPAAPKAPAPAPAPAMDHAQHAMPAAPKAPAPAMDHAAHAMAMPAPDTGFAALQARGKRTMGVDQYTSQHVFQDLPNGGRIILERDPKDTAGVATIRAHLRDITAAFTRGDFSTPFATHAQEVPGTAVMTARRDKLRYAMKERPGGGEVRITTTDAQALKAVRAFLAFQRKDHRAPGTPPAAHKMP
ncbi:MAG: hypothetical protein HY275_09610 [Gemmatimonadetes bacterium]|nr:hypothetical protein [Gemmatimonadota bacterium]